MTQQESVRTPSDRNRSEKRRDPAGSHDPFTCPECGAGSVTDAERGETHCTECGLVLEEELVDHGPEWRAFDPGERERKRRVGSPRTEQMHDHGLSTVIGWDDRDAHGRALSSRKRQTIQRLRTWDERFRTKDARELLEATEEADSRS